ncbi:hypothetical protein [Pseudomonas fulva]|nr:hypothetical protein [Pseudomonas fulva]MBF8781234.1 hypothetical protein [Pseudomonas fulva]
MKDQLLELIRLVGAGCMPDEQIERIAEEAAQAYADPAGFLAANPDVNYDDSFPIALGEWVVVGSLPDTVLFQADSYQELFQRITESFDKSVPFNLKPKQLARTEPLTALNRIQVQMAALNKEAGGYVLVNFSQLLDDELQMVLVGQHDLARLLELSAELGIAAAPALEALRVAAHV